MKYFSLRSYTLPVPMPITLLPALPRTSRTGLFCYIRIYIRAKFKAHPSLSLTHTYTRSLFLLSAYVSSAIYVSHSRLVYMCTRIIFFIYVSGHVFFYFFIYFIFLRLLRPYSTTGPIVPRNGDTRRREVR